MEERDCPRCGALLPDADEGVCQTCGYEYGRATLFMPALHLIPPEDLPALAEDLAAPAPMTSPPAASATAEDPQRRKLITLLAVIVALLFLSLAGLIALYFSQQPAAAP